MRGIKQASCTNIERNPVISTSYTLQFTARKSIPLRQHTLAPDSQVLCHMVQISINRAYVTTQMDPLHHLTTRCCFAPASNAPCEHDSVHDIYSFALFLLLLESHVYDECLNALIKSQHDTYSSFRMTTNTHTDGWEQETPCKTTILEHTVLIISDSICTKCLLPADYIHVINDQDGLSYLYISHSLIFVGGYLRFTQEHILCDSSFSLGFFRLPLTQHSHDPSSFLTLPTPTSLYMT